MITILRPILFQFLGSNSFKKLMIDLLTAMAKRTDNKLDDAAVELITKALSQE